MSVVAPASRSMRVPAPRNDEYGVCVDGDARVVRLLAGGRRAAGSTRAAGSLSASSVSRKSVSGIAQVGRLAAADGQQDGAVRRLLDAVGAAHQADVGVEVHRLVGLVREGGVRLALEDRELGVEGPGEAAVELRDALGGERGALGDGGFDGACRSSASSSARPRSTWSAKNRSTWSSTLRASAWSRSQLGGPGVVLGQLARDRRASTTVRRTRPARTARARAGTGRAAAASMP